MTTKYNKISVEQLRTILKDNISITLINNGRLYKISPIICHIAVSSSSNSILKHDGFMVSFDKGDLRRKCINIDTLLKYLKREKVLLNDEMEMESISGRWKSYEEYDKDKRFLTITMSELLVRYRDADTFSLTGVYNDGFSKEYPFGIYGIDEKTAEMVLEKINKVTLEMLKKQYDRFSNEEKSKLPDFESLLLEIQKECDEYFSLVETDQIPVGQSRFLADLVFKGKTKYSQPLGICHFYDRLYSQLIDYKKAITEMQKNSELKDLKCIFDNPYYKELAECLITTEVTFTWHCTTSSQLSVVYYFKMNETSLKWLCKLKDDYDMGELNDLAFYQNGKLIFSSCTHECVHYEFII